MKTIDLTDAVLLENLQSGDHTAFDQLYTKYWKPLYRLSFKVLKDELESEDVVQETFVRFWENRKTLNGSNIKGWLATTSYRLTLKKIQSQKRHVSIEGVTYEEPMAERADESFNTRQLQLQINNCVNQLPDQCRKVYQMRRLDELSVKDTASMLGISAKTVEGHVTTALKRIRHAISSAMILLLFL
ncbi:RNA polymerase sigma factor [Pararcticibacter amylolyticus]|uniref:RNA polymerase sigma factor n=1 Tax=Pararcticibacter amylolyticus TaxID=2173175 RepID=UPI001304D7CB|nr:RNA polymerase sigma-70 factor [Pararcticibacter amylolyticus]